MEMPIPITADSTAAMENPLTVSRMDCVIMRRTPASVGSAESRVTMRLPLALPEMRFHSRRRPICPAIPASPKCDLAASTILIVDDNAQNRELLEAYLEPLGCTLESAADGVEAMARLDDTGRPLPDLVLLDVMMPRMSGFEVCERIRGEDRTRGLPVMMVTALNELNDVERGVEAGTDDFLSKPVNRLELVTRVKSLLRVRHLTRELEQAQQRLRDVSG